MSYINREETIMRIEEYQSLFTGTYFDLIGKVKDIVKNMPDELSVKEPPAACMLDSLKEFISNLNKKTIVDDIDNDVDTNKYDEDEFIERFCRLCGTQRCEGIGTEWFEGCHYKDNLKRSE